MQTQIKNSGNFTLNDANADHKAWKDLLNLGEKATASDFVSASKSAGDSVMTRVYSHVKNDDGRIDEQIDKENGTQISAKTLTWSHANILHALKVRKSLTSQQMEYLQ
jgi:GH15 family glucan-1,4-alpha-glucosidase